MKIKYLFYLFIFFLVYTSHCQENNILEKLGFEKDSKLLIIHNDDIGMSQSVNSASFDAFDKGYINSGSVMVPCPWFLEVVQYSKKNPNLDIGIHLTLTSEWKNYKWGGVSSSDKIKSILDEKGHFYPEVSFVQKNAKYNEVKIELEAQINYFLSNGLIPTHLDTHMGAVRATPKTLQAYLEVGNKFQLPVQISEDYKSILDNKLIDFTRIDKSKILFVKKIYGKQDDTPINYEEWMIFYKKVLDDIKPGLNVLLVHVGYDNDELKAITVDHPHWGSKWRELDFKILESQEFRNRLKNRNIELVTWNQIKKVLYD